MAHRCSDNRGPTVYITTHCWGWGFKSLVNLNEVTTTINTTSVAAAGKVKTPHHPLQLSNIAVHVHPSLQAKIFTNKILRMEILQMTTWPQKLHLSKICTYVESYAAIECHSSHNKNSYTLTHVPHSMVKVYNNIARVSYVRNAYVSSIGRIIQNFIY